MSNNAKLIALLNAWSRDMSKSNYAKVRKELMEGNSVLMLPTAKDKNIEKNSLISLYTIEGQKTLAVFTDNESILKWSKGKDVSYNKLRSQAVFAVCEQNEIKRIIINNGTNNIFPLW